MQEVRTIITKDSQSYRVLAITLLSGECSDEAVALLLQTDNYRQKVLYKLTTDKLLYRYQKDDVKGYRLTKQGKELLLSMDAERFSFFGADGADFAMRKTDVRSRRRQHRISEVLAIMESAGIEIHRDKKNQLFDRHPIQSQEKAQSAFYHTKEVKVQENLTRKIINSKMTGAWFTNGTLWLCYNMAEEIIFWYETVENRADILISSLLQKYMSEQKNANALLFGYTMDQLKICLSDAKQKSYFMNCSFERFCYVPMNSEGIILLEMLKDPELYAYLFSILSEDLGEKDESEYLIHDGFNEKGEPVLISIDCDLKRLIQFQTQLTYANRRGEIICFDFQKEAIREYCGEETKISEVDFETVRQNFFSG